MLMISELRFNHSLLPFDAPFILSTLGLPAPASAFRNEVLRATSECLKMLIDRCYLDFCRVFWSKFGLNFI